VTADLGKLVGFGTASDDSPVIDLGLSCQADIANEDAMVSDHAVVGYMGIRHYQGVVADFGNILAAGLGSAVDCRAFAYGNVVSQLDGSDFTIELEILWDSPDYSTGIDLAVLSHLHVLENRSVREYLASVTDLYIIVDEGKGTDLDVVTENGFGTYRCKRRNNIHDSICCLV
jgi:hypothetical protein